MIRRILLRAIGCGLVAGALASVGGCVPLPLPPVGLPLHKSMHDGLSFSKPAKRTSGRRQRALLGQDLESFPVLTSAIYWYPVYDRMVELGIEPYRARVNTRRAAHMGPAQPEVLKICTVPAATTR